MSGNRAERADLIRQLREYASAVEATRHTVIKAAIKRFGGPVIAVPTKAPCS